MARFATHLPYWRNEATEGLREVVEAFSGPCLFHPNTRGSEDDHLNQSARMLLLGECVTFRDSLCTICWGWFVSIRNVTS